MSRIAELIAGSGPAVKLLVEEAEDLPAEVRRVRARECGGVRGIRGSDVLLALITGGVELVGVRPKRDVLAAQPQFLARKPLGHHRAQGRAHQPPVLRVGAGRDLDPLGTGVVLVAKGLHRHIRVVQAIAGVDARAAAGRARSGRRSRKHAVVVIDDLLRPARHGGPEGKGGVGRHAHPECERHATQGDSATRAHRRPDRSSALRTAGPYATSTSSSSPGGPPVRIPRPDPRLRQCWALRSSSSSDLLQ